MAARIFGFSAVIALLSLAAGLAYGGWQAAFFVLILGVLEISLSFDNAVVNATVLQRMSPFWQRMFLTVGIVIAVFGMRVLFPLLVVWATSGMAPGEALSKALSPPEGGAAYFPDGTPSYETAITAAHPQIAAFGGMFLLMLFLDFVLEERHLTWLTWIEVPLARAGRLSRLSVILGGGALLGAGLGLAPPESTVAVLTSGLLGMLTYLAVNGLGALFEDRMEAEAEASDDDAADSGTSEASDSAGGTGPSGPAKATGTAGFFLFLYLEVLDASFSFDGVVGAFAITADPVIIALGLGGIGAIFVRSITIYLVRTGTLYDYEYLEHGAHWAIGALAAIMLVGIDHELEVPEVVTGLVGVVFIGASLLSSFVRNKRLTGSISTSATSVADQPSSSEGMSATDDSTKSGP